MARKHHGVNRGGSIPLPPRFANRRLARRCLRDVRLGNAVECPRTTTTSQHDSGARPIRTTTRRADTNRKRSTGPRSVTTIACNSPGAVPRAQAIIGPARARPGQPHRQAQRSPLNESMNAVSIRGRHAVTRGDSLLELVPQGVDRRRIVLAERAKDSHPVGTVYLDRPCSGHERDLLSAHPGAIAGLRSGREGELLVLRAHPSHKLQTSTTAFRASARILRRTVSTIARRSRRVTSST